MGGSVETFIKHIKFIILPKIKHKETQFQIIDSWIKNKETAMLKKLLQEKNTFLFEAYKNALEYSPSSPLSVIIRPIEFGNTIGFDENSTKRIVQELVSDGYLTSTLGMKQIIVTTSGLNYLNMLEFGNAVQKESSINLNIGNNSNVQFQNGNQNTANLSINHNTFDYERFIKEINSNFPILLKHLTEDKINELKVDIDYLNDKVKNGSSSKSVLNTIKDSIIEIVKTVPAGVLSAYLENIVS